MAQCNGGQIAMVIRYSHADVTAATGVRLVGAFVAKSRVWYLNL